MDPDQAATVLTEETPRKQRRKRVNYALAATLVAQHVTLNDAAIQSGAKDGNSLRVGLARRGVTATQARHSDGQVQRAVIVANKAVSAASEALREDLASILAKHTSALGEIKPRANLKHIRAVGDAIEPLARTAKIVHDWGNTDKPGLTMVGLWQEPAPQEPQERVLIDQQVVVETKNPLPDTNPS